MKKTKWISLPALILCATLLLSACGAEQSAATELELVTSLDQAILALASGKCDAVALDGTTAKNYVDQSDGLFAMSGIIPEDAHHGYLGMIYEFDYESGDIVNQFAIQKQFYRATELPLKVDPICEPIAAGSIVGALPRPQAVKADVPEPVGTLTEEVVLTRTGSALFVSALNRSVSQVIFAGREHTYVYDNTGVKLESENYLDFTANMPVALGDLEPDEYSLLCVYRDALYKLTADGGEAYINVTAP